MNVIFGVALALMVLYTPIVFVQVWRDKERDARERRLLLRGAVGFEASMCLMIGYLVSGHVALLIAGLAGMVLTVLSFHDSDETSSD